MGFLNFGMDGEDYSAKSNESSVSAESEHNESQGSFHTPLNSPPKNFGDEQLFLTPFDSPVNEVESADMHSSQIRLTCPTSSSTMPSSDSGTEIISQTNLGAHFLLPPPCSFRKSTSCSKPQLAESPVSSMGYSDCEESHSPITVSSQQPNKEKNKSNSMKIQFSPRKIVSTVNEPFHLLQPHSFYPSPASKKSDDDSLCDFSFNASEEPYQETEHVLQKFTKSPEFLQLKDSVSADEINEKVNKAQKALLSNPSESMLLKDIINVPQLKNRDRNNSLGYMAQKPDRSYYRKSSLDNLNTISASSPSENLYGSLKIPKKNKILNVSIQHRKSSLDSLKSFIMLPANPLEELHTKSDYPRAPSMNHSNEKPKGNLLNFSSSNNNTNTLCEKIAGNEFFASEKNEKDLNALEPYILEKKERNDENDLKNLNARFTEVEEKSSSLKNLQILESQPITDIYRSGESSSPYDLSRLKKPSSRLGDLLEYCKKNSKGKTNVASPVKYVSQTSLLPADESLANSSKNLLLDFEKFPAIFRDEIGQTSANSFAPLIDMREKRTNFACCIKPLKDSELSFGLLENIDNDDEESDVSCSQSVKKMFSSENANGGKVKGKVKRKSKELGKKIKATKSSSAEADKSKEYNRRLDQSYCDLLKQMHNDMQKQRGKIPKKQAGRLCQSDPPRMIVAPEKNLANPFQGSEKASAVESFYDFNVRSEPNTSAEECLEFECEPYSKRPQPKDKGKLERTESFYDNKKSNAVKLERIESLYDNHKKTSKSEESCGSEVRNCNAEILDVPYFPDCESEEEKTSPPKPLMTFLPSEWWPVVDPPKTNVNQFWSWRPPSEVRF